MKKLTITLLGVLALSSVSYAGYVNGYTKSNGTYVDGYYRSDANGTTSDNYSTYGNTNPYTGKRGSRRY
jgi:hypothetical protein